jgi:hypothetical protein
MSKECECGNPKTVDAEGCSRCTFLDRGVPIGITRGGHGAEPIISAMRDGCSTLEALQAATGRSYESLHNSMKRLVSIGRVRKHVEDVEPTWRTINGREKKHQGATKNVYTLCAREDLTRYQGATC